MSNISEQELYILSYYRACELAGAILFGKIALHSDIDEVRIPLTEHCLEEAEHAWRWTKAIHDLGYIPVKVSHAYQSEYGKEFGMPKNILEIFCLTQVFEKRTLEHFHMHLNMPNVHPMVKDALRKMIDDETGHVGWIRQELDKYSQENGKEEVDKVMKELEEIDERVYSRIITSSPFKEFFNA